jgi:CHAD domain-containing protein
MQRTPLPVRLLRQRLLSLLNALPSATSGDVTSVHRARVASRRLREVLPVLAEAAGSDTLDRAGKHVRRITRALGPIRELDVALGHLAEIGERASIPPGALAAVRTHLENDRQVQREAMLGIITPSAIARLKGQLHHSAPQRPQLQKHDVEQRSARRRSARRGLRLRKDAERTGALYDPERLHAVRVATKKLRYALEVERELAGSRATARIQRLKRLQDALGQVHDYEILLDRTREVQASLAGSDRRTSDELNALVRILEEACREGHAGFMRDRGTLLALCDSVITAAREGRPTFMV